MKVRTVNFNATYGYIRTTPIEYILKQPDPKNKKESPKIKKDLKKN